MLFSSPVFLFAFLPVILIAYYIFPSKARKAFLLAASLFFYAWGETAYVTILIVSIGLNYAAGLCVDRFKHSNKKKWVLAVATGGNLGLLGVFKYTNFIIENINILLSTLTVSTLDPVALHFPIGISFFTFKALSYLFDVYRGRISVQRNILDVALYISLFPHLLAGPIARFEEIAESLRSRTANAGLFVSGIERFIFGLAKKMLIADSLGGVADQIFSLSPANLTFGVSWLGIVCFTLQIYFDFSGYSDMAIGIGRMFGFSIRENFDFPYISTSIREFWRRWHISLSTWFRDYLYVSLGGNRCKPWRVYVNLFTVFFLCGLWHGASWTFVVWGMIHGLFIVGERLGLDALLAKTWRPVRHIYAMMIVTVGWVFFRAETLPYALEYVQALFGFGSGDRLVYYPELYLTTWTTGALLMGIVFSTPVSQLYTRHVEPVFDSNPVFYFCSKVVPLGALLFLSILQVAVSTYNPFIYFKF